MFKRTPAREIMRSLRKNPKGFFVQPDNMEETPVKGYLIPIKSTARRVSDRDSIEKFLSEAYNPPEHGTTRWVGGWNRDDGPELAIWVQVGSASFAMKMARMMGVSTIWDAVGCRAVEVEPEGVDETT